MLRKRRHYTGAFLLLAIVACQEKPIDQGALLTARTVGLAELERGRLSEAEQEFKQVIALAPKDASGYANLGLTYLRSGPTRFADAEEQLERARRLDPRSPEIALILARLYALTGRPEEARRVLADIEPDARVLYTLAQLDRQTGGDTAYAGRLRQLLAKVPSNLAVRIELADVLLRLGESDSTLRHLEDIRRLRPEAPRDAQPHLDAAIRALRASRHPEARMAFDRFRRAIEVTAPYQASLALVNWTEGPIAGNQTFSFSPQTLITMRGIRPPPAAAPVQFTDVTNESGLPERSEAPTALALGDYDGDGIDNLLLAVGQQVQLYAMQQGFLTDVTARMPVPLPRGALVATFVDYDNDGWLDLFAIGTDHLGYLVRNREGQQFEDVTERAGVREVGSATRILFVDLDHDGDLDLLLVGNESRVVYRNNADGTFALLPNAAGILQGGSDAGVADVNDDGRVDVVIASATGTQGLFLNDAVQGFVRAADMIHGPGPVAVGDYDNDGALDFYLAGTGLWHNSGTGTFTRDTRAGVTARSGGEARFFDYDNDGWLDLFTAGASGASLFHNRRGGRFEDRTALLPPDIRRAGIGPVLASDLDGDGDQDLLLGTRSGAHFLRNDGGNAHLGMRIQLTALRTGSSKNNTFGIGARLEVRAGELYQTRVVTDRLTQIGLGTHLKADVLRVQWTNGVPQTVYFPGTDADVLELQQLKGSCAFLYTWDGEQFRFVTDIMWQSALGMPVGIMGARDSGLGTRAMSYAPAGASLEYVRIPGEALRPRNGRYVIQVTEELWETAYLDQLRLLAVDHPDSVAVFVDERFPPMRGTDLRLFQVVRRRAPLSAVDERGTDVLADLTDHDFRYVSNLTPRRYQGLTEPHALVLELDEHAGEPGTHLLLRGWIFPSDASINVALSQQQVLKSEMPVIEVRDARDRWIPRGMIGFPAGKDKTMVIDLAGIFPTKDRHVRVRTSMQIYWDQAFVADDANGGGRGGPESTAAVTRVTTLTPLSGDLHYRGFSRMYRRGGRYGPHWFDYSDVTRESPWRPITGAATRFGSVRPLLEHSDDQYIVMVPGDEATVAFDAAGLKEPAPGWKRTFFLYSDGWIKDSDLNTAYGTTVEPLPYHAITSYPYGPSDGYPADSARQRYLREYNTRIIRQGASNDH